ncbi:hypothetical protein RYX36_019502, partial [Vicia faba]
MVAQAGEEILRQVEAEYPALLFKQQLTTYVEKIYGIISDNLRKENFPSWIMSSGMVQTFTTDSERRVRLTVSARRRGGRHATCSEQQTVEEPYKEVAELHLDVQDIGADDAEVIQIVNSLLNKQYFTPDGIPLARGRCKELDRVSETF